MGNIRLDKNYRIVSSQNESASSAYYDELNHTIDRVISLKQKGIITEDFAKELLKIVLEKHLQEEVSETISPFANNPKESKKANMLLLKWVNETTYA